MDRWNDYVVELIWGMARNDDHYRKLRMELAEQDYRIIMSKLSDEERECVERYISVCKELEYRKAQLAYLVGLLEKRK